MEIFRALKPITTDLDRKDRTRIYKLHNDHVHTTEECGSLKGQIKA